MGNVWALCTTLCLSGRKRLIIISQTRSVRYCSGARARALTPIVASGQRRSNTINSQVNEHALGALARPVSATRALERIRSYTFFVLLVALPKRHRRCVSDIHIKVNSSGKRLQKHGDLLLPMRLSPPTQLATTVSYCCCSRHRHRWRRKRRQAPNEQHALVRQLHCHADGQ